MSRRMRKGRKLIDQWEFKTQQSYREADHATFAIYMTRPVDMQEKIEGTSVRVKFSAYLISSESSPSLAKAEIQVDDDDINKLRKKVQQAFEDATCKDWKKVILVSVGAGTNYRHHESMELKFNWCVCEKGGNLYRREDGWITRNAHDLCGDLGDDQPTVLDWDQETEDALANVDAKLEELTTRLAEMVKDKKRLLALPRSEKYLLV